MILTFFFTIHIMKLEQKHSGKILFLFLLSVVVLIGAILALSPVTIAGNT